MAKEDLKTSSLTHKFKTGESFKLPLDATQYYGAKNSPINKKKKKDIPDY